jgi:hypothetical protein
MNPNLDAIVSADGEARAHVEAARAAGDARTKEAADERERRRQARYDALCRAADEEERAIEESADRAVADRQSIRARYREARRRAAEGALLRAADEYARIIADGPHGTSR